MRAGPRLLVQVLSLVALACLPRPGGPDQRAAVKAGTLVGTWRLLSVEERQPNGEILHWLGRQPRGLIIYDRTGHVSVQIMRDPGSPPPAAGSGDAYYAYFGTYGVNEQEATVTHRIQGSMRPAEIGADYTRSVRLDGDRLTLGLTPTRSLTWQRVR